MPSVLLAKMKMLHFWMPALDDVLQIVAGN
jgi:hypothetical protein